MSTKLDPGPDTPRQTGDVIEIPETDALRMENFLLRRQLLQVELDKLCALEKVVHEEICSRLGIRGRYQIDLMARRAVREDP